MANTRIPSDDQTAEDTSRAESAGANSEETRETRKQSREHDSRVDELSEERATHQSQPAPWIRPSSLTAPPARDGFVQRWIRVTVRGVEDPRNVNMKFREGWSPRAMDTIPGEFLGLGIRADQADGHFVVDDLMLCEMPKEMYQQRADYYQSQTDQQMVAVETDLENVEVPGQPIMKTHKSTVSYPPPRVQGRRAQPAADDDF